MLVYKKIQINHDIDRQSTKSVIQKNNAMKTYRVCHIFVLISKFRNHIIPMRKLQK